MLRDNSSSFNITHLIQLQATQVVVSWLILLLPIKLVLDLSNNGLQETLKLVDGQMVFGIKSSLGVKEHQLHIVEIIWAKVHILLSKELQLL